MSMCLLHNGIMGFIQAGAGPVGCFKSIDGCVTDPVVSIFMYSVHMHGHVINSWI